MKSVASWRSTLPEKAVFHKSRRRRYSTKSSVSTLWGIISLSAYPLGHAVNRHKPPGLANVASSIDAGQEKRILLVLDRAGWHSNQTLTAPDGIHLVFFPPCSPEVQSAERLWSLSNVAIANRHFQALDELQEVQAQRYVTL